MSTSDHIKIGELIRQEVESKGIKVSHFADMINSTRQNIHNIYKRESIDTALLFEISRCLGRDFFSEYSKILYSEGAISKVAETSSIDYESSEGVHYHIHLSDLSKLDSEDQAKLLRSIKDELGRKDEGQSR